MSARRILSAPEMSWTALDFRSVGVLSAAVRNALASLTSIGGLLWACREFRSGCVLCPCLDLGVKPERRQNAERDEGCEHGELRDEKRRLVTPTKTFR